MLGVCGTSLGLSGWLALGITVGMGNVHTLKSETTINSQTILSETTMSFQIFCICQYACLYAHRTGSLRPAMLLLQPAEVQPEPLVG